MKVYVVEKVIDSYGDTGGVTEVFSSPEKAKKWIQAEMQNETSFEFPTSIDYWESDGDSWTNTPTIYSCTLREVIE